MKKRDLEKRLKELGWVPCGGTKHDAWTNGTIKEYVPRHSEIPEYLARKILRTAEQNPPKS